MQSFQPGNLQGAILILPLQITYPSKFLNDPVGLEFLAFMIGYQTFFNQ